MGRKSLYKQDWVVALILGILVFIFGVSLSLYLISGTSNLNTLVPIFFAGWGFGYIVCSFTIRKYEKKTWEIDGEAKVDEQQPKT